MKLRNKLLVPGFIAAALLQLAVPLKMVYDSEATAATGTVYKFRTEPIDPSDPFRGKYITLNYKDDEVKVADTTWGYNEKAYVYIGTGSDGFARVTRLSRRRLDIPNDYFPVHVHGCYDGRAVLEFPFSRFYMEESKAPEAEAAYRMYSDSAAKPAYALVAVKDGNTVLKEVMIDGMPIRDYVLKQRKGSKGE